MSQSNTGLNGVFWNYIVNMFSVLIRKVIGATFFFCCGGFCCCYFGFRGFLGFFLVGFFFPLHLSSQLRWWKFQQHYIKKLVVGEKKPRCYNFLFCFGKAIIDKEILTIFWPLHFSAVKPKKGESWHIKDFPSCCQIVAQWSSSCVTMWELLLVTGTQLRGFGHCLLWKWPCFVKKKWDLNRLWLGKNPNQSQVNYTKEMVFNNFCKCILMLRWQYCRSSTCYFVRFWTSINSLNSNSIC